jgi:hypothetical protein
MRHDEGNTLKYQDNRIGLRTLPLNAMEYRKTANDWVLLTFLVDTRHECSTLGTLSLTASLPIAVDAAAPEEEAAHASEPVTAGVSTPFPLSPSHSTLSSARARLSTSPASCI